MFLLYRHNYVAAKDNSIKRFLMFFTFLYMYALDNYLVSNHSIVVDSAITYRLGPFPYKSLEGYFSVTDAWLFQFASRTHQ